MYRSITIVCLLFFALRADAQLGMTGRRGTPAGGSQSGSNATASPVTPSIGGNSSGFSYGGTSSATAVASVSIIAPVQIKILHWPEDFVTKSGAMISSNRWEIFSVDGAPDYAIAVTSPTKAILIGSTPNMGTVEVTGIHPSEPERILFPGLARRYSNDLRFGLLANQPEVGQMTSQSGTYEGSCAVTVGYN